MSSILSRGPKQIPTDGQYYVALRNTGSVNLLIFNNDAAASTTPYVSGAAAGNFTSSNVTYVAFDLSGSTSLFRDMGTTVVSSGRTFRGVQLLQLDATATNGANAGGSGWTSSNSGTAGVWKPSNEGVQGGITATNVGGDYQTYFFETGARALGVAQGLVRYG
jgi:hypothetical protein